LSNSVKLKASLSARLLSIDGNAGTVERGWLDELHGPRIWVRGRYGSWPVSTIKLAQTN
jgi:hypothetical protein